MEVIVTSLVRFVYKLFTGRIQPTSMGVIVQLQPVTSKDIPVNPTFKETTGPSGGVPASCSMSYWAADPPFDPFFWKAPKKIGMGKKASGFFFVEKKNVGKFQDSVVFFFGGASLDIFACDFRGMV